MKDVRHHDVLPFSVDSHRSTKAVARAGRAAAFAFLVAAGLPFPTQAEVLWFTDFESSTFRTSTGDGPSNDGFWWVQQKAGTNRATTVNTFPRNGVWSLRLHTEPGDSNADCFPFSCSYERNDAALRGAIEETTDGREGRDQWWAHSILFPSDFSPPPANGWGTVFQFHNYSQSGQPNFGIFTPSDGTLYFRGYGGPNVSNGSPTFDPWKFEALIDQRPIERNVWYDFVYHVKWSSGPDGAFDAWVKRPGDAMPMRILAHQGPTLYEGFGSYLKLSNYHVTMPPTSVIHDRVFLGTTWQDVVYPGTSLEGQHEENAASYTPSPWTQYGSESGIFSGGTSVASDVTNATATFTFTGTAVRWMGVKCENCGIATVSIDGGAPTDVNTVGPPVAPGGLKSESVFYASGLAPGVSHTMVITVTDRKDLLSGGFHIAVDGFWVLPIEPTPPN